MNKHWVRSIFESCARKETLSILLIGLFSVIALCSIFVSPQLYQWNIHEGDVALKDTYAPYDFAYFWEIDEEKTAGAKEAAGKMVPFSVRRSAALEEDTAGEVSRFFDAVEAEREQGIPLNEKINNLKNASGKEISDKNLKLLLEYPDAEELRIKTLDVLKYIFQVGYLNDENLKFLEEKGVGKVSLYNEGTGTQTESSLSAIINKSALQTVADNFAVAEFVKDRKVSNAVSSLMTSMVLPNLRLDEKKTEAEKGEAVKKVEPVYKRWEVKKNELIVEKGKRVNPQHIAQILQLRSVFRPGTTPTFFLGVVLLFILLGAIAFVFLSFSGKAAVFLADTKTIAIILLNMLFIITVADFVMRSPQPSYFIPMASIGMILTLLVNFNVAFLCVITMGILISLLVGGGTEVFLVLLAGSMAGMFFVRDARRRMQILWAGLLAGLAKLIAIGCIGLINGMGLDFFVHDGTWAIASGLLSGFIVMGFLPVFEHLFKVPTNISLLELSDLNHPLLKKLAMEAPGTYHHSIMVGNLAEAACDAIGANSLLARVGAYYHDIGKISKAEYFSENEMTFGSKHSNLAPSMSALIIAKHVKEGEEIARKYKLNSKIIDFITQHHGDSLIFYFYQKAVKKSKEMEKPKEENFRYPGPKPQTKESAIVLLADSVEASSRTLVDPTPASIRNLVKKIINNKFIDAQLDSCDLTLKDMNTIADSFVRVLTGIFHTRLDYPEDIKKKVNKIFSDDNNKFQKPK